MIDYNVIFQIEPMAGFLEKKREKHLPIRHDQKKHAHLYHGTRGETFERIKQEGLKSGVDVKTTTGKKAKIYLGEKSNVAKFVGCVSAIMHSDRPFVYVIELSMDNERLMGLEQDEDSLTSYVTKKGILKKDFLSVRRYTIKKQIFDGEKQHLAFVSKYMKGTSLWQHEQDRLADMIKSTDDLFVDPKGKVIKVKN